MHRLTAWMGGVLLRKFRDLRSAFSQNLQPPGIQSMQGCRGHRRHVLDWHMLGVCAGRGLKQLYVGDLFAEVFDSIGEAPVSLRCRT